MLIISPCLGTIVNPLNRFGLWLKLDHCLLPDIPDDKVFLVKNQGWKYCYIHRQYVNILYAGSPQCTSMETRILVVSCCGRTSRHPESDFSTIFTAVVKQITVSKRIHSPKWLLLFFYQS